MKVVPADSGKHLRGMRMRFMDGLGQVKIRGQDVTCHPPVQKYVEVLICYTVAAGTAVIQLAQMVGKQPVFHDMFVLIGVAYFFHQRLFTLEVFLRVRQQRVEHKAHGVGVVGSQNFGTNLCREIKKIPVIVVDIFVADR